MFPNHSRFPQLRKKIFFAGSWFRAALENVGTICFSNEFWKEARMFVVGLASTVLSTFALDQMMGMDWAAFVLRFRLRRMITLNICLTSFWIVWWGSVGNVTLTRMPSRLKTNFLCSSRDGWKATARNLSRCHYHSAFLVLMSWFSCTTLSATHRY